MVLAATFPGGPIPDAVKTERIAHLTSHQIAIVEIKVFAVQVVVYTRTT